MIGLIAGMPRAGTTLVCACLNHVPDCVALAEPMDPPAHPMHEIDPAARYPEVDLGRLAAPLTTIVPEVAPFYPDFAADLEPHRRG